jgi:hypothetical protein
MSDGHQRTVAHAAGSDLSFQIDMTIFRRFLVFAVLCLWQGGFVFFSGVAVPIGRDLLGARSDQTRITSRVSTYINLAGAVSLAPLLWDTFAPDPSARRRWLRAAIWGVLLITLLAQFYLYREMNAVVEQIIAGYDPPQFHWQHKAYLWISTAQLAAAVSYMVLALLAWQAQDRLEGNAACGRAASPQAANAGD